MKPDFFKTALTVVLLFVLTSTLGAFDSVFLRTGELFTGKVLRINKKEVSIQLESGGILSFRKSQVLRVRRWFPDKPLPEVLDFSEENTDTSIEPLPPVSDPVAVEPTAPTETTPVTNPVIETLEAPTVEPEETTVEVAVDVEPNIVSQAASPKKGWSFETPANFKPNLEEPSPELVGSWVEPITQATLTLATYSDGTSVQDVKQMILQEMPGPLPPHIFRDLPLNRKGEGGFEGWILEVKQELADTAVQQVNLFAARGPVTFVLRCTAPAGSYPLISNAFEESLHTLRIYDEHAPSKEEG